MTLAELKKTIDNATKLFEARGESAENIPVVVQIDWKDGTSVLSQKNIEVSNVSDAFSSRCVITADGKE